MVRRILVGVVLGVLSLGAAGSADAAWDGPRAIVGDIATSNYAVGMGAAGQTVAAWTGDTGIYVASAARGGSFGRITRLATSDTANPGRLLVVNGRGDALVVWVAPPVKHNPQGALFAAYRRAGRGFSRAVKIAPHAQWADAGLDGQGNATLVWMTQQRGRTALLARTRSSSGHLAGPRQVVRATAISNASMSENGRGDAIVVWSAGSAATATIRYSARAHGHGFNHPQGLGLAGHGVTLPSVGMDGSGHALIAWYAKPFFGGYREVDAASVRVFPSRFPAGRPSKRVLRTELLLIDTLRPTPPQVNVDARGDVMIVWQVYRSVGQPSRVQVARGRPGQTLSPRMIVIGDPSEPPGVALGPRGAAVVSWDDEEGSMPDQAAVALHATSPFGPAQPISSAADEAATPAVAIDARGDAVAIWQDLGPSLQLGPDVPATPLLYATSTG